MSTPILNPQQRWYCPECGVTAVTHDATPHTRYHTCAGLKGLEAPLLPAGTKGHLRAVEREDYLGNQIGTQDGEGRQIMSIVTEREDGQDVNVLAPTALIRVGG